MRSLLVVFAASMVSLLFAAPSVARADFVNIFSVETPAQMVDRLRAEALNGKIDAAIAELSDYVRDHPRDLVAARLLGDLYYRKPDLAAAERVYKLIVERFPQDRETWNRLGGIYAAEDRVDDAIVAFDRSIPEPSAYTNLVELHRRRGDLAAFQAEIAAQAQQTPSNQRTLLIYGNVLRAVHQYSTAIGVFKQALALDFNQCAALNDLANAYLDIGRVNDAIPLLQRCLTLDPKAYFALVNIGEANIEQGHYAEARPFLERAQKENPYRPEAYVDLGFLEDVNQHWKPAVALYEKAIDVDPLWRDAYIDLGYDFNEHELYPQAEAAFLKGLSVSPHDGRLAYMLGVTYVQQGKVALARQQYEHALSDSDEEIVVKAARRELLELPAAQ